ncbi:MAG: AzlD domain-containing protein [Succinivibrio sp.]|nr:AzlD domain-containing protein [Succinivibrio sp.]
MSEHYFLYVILGVAFVSYLLRCIPAAFISKLNLSSYFKRLLDLVPYTAMTALVFPGIFYSVGEHQTAAVAGTLAALISAFLKAPLALTVVIAVLTVLVCLLV